MTTKKGSLTTPRFLKIGYQFYESRHRDRERRGKPRQTPYLRLSGDWLQAAGFEVGRKVCVQIVDQFLVMSVVED